MMHRSMSQFFFRKVVKTKIHVYEILTHEGRNRIMSASSPTTFVDKYLVQRNKSFYPPNRMNSDNYLGN